MAMAWHLVRGENLGAFAAVSRGGGVVLGSLL